VSLSPDPMPDDWRDILKAWLLGKSLAWTTIGHERETLQFIEDGLVFLPWALEAIRVRAATHDDTVDGTLIDDFDLGYAVSAAEMPEEGETWMTAPAVEALELQRPLTDGALRIVAGAWRKTPRRRPRKYVEVVTCSRRAA